MLRDMAKSGLDFSLLPAADRARGDRAGAGDHGHAAENPLSIFNPSTAKRT